ncbi:uncharacterized protein LOC116004058 [Ipomoea triloba]|uniref:uncharacterized protein LOC116004058 n=1 Tax=Ipomoea triloba TaxID=35885 RepID=UPI00125DF130|nr:uncharacterized protein LOC116004058 [Ipomoea triloba]
MPSPFVKGISPLHTKRAEEAHQKSRGGEIMKRKEGCYTEQRSLDLLHFEAKQLPNSKRKEIQKEQRVEEMGVAVSQRTQMDLLHAMTELICREIQSRNLELNKLNAEAMKGQFAKMANAIEGLNGRIERMEGDRRPNHQNEGQNERENERVNVRVNERRDEGNTSEEDRGEEYDMRRRRDNRGYRRDRDEEDDDIRNINAPTPNFMGKRDPDVYLEWERKVDRIFDCHNYSERKKT